MDDIIFTGLKHDDRYQNFHRLHVMVNKIRGITVFDATVIMVIQGSGISHRVYSHSLIIGCQVGVFPSMYILGILID